MITVTVQLFAELAERAAAREVTLELAADATAAHAYDAVIDRYPALAVGRERVALAVDDAYVAPTTPLRDGAIVALIPPVSGG